VETLCTMPDASVVSGQLEGSFVEVQVSTPTELTVEKQSPSVSFEVQPQRQRSVMDASAIFNIPSADLVVESTTSANASGSVTGDATQEKSRRLSRSGTRTYARRGTRSLARATTASLAEAHARQEKIALKPVSKTLHPDKAKDSRLSRCGFNLDG